MTQIHAPRAMTALLAVTGVLLAGYAAHALVDLGGSGADDLFLKWVNDAVVILAAGACVWRAVRVAHQRWAWGLIGVGMVSWAGGNIWYSLFLIDVDPFPVPSVADGLWLGIYPPVYVAIALLARDRVRGLGVGIWLDGVIAACAVGAVSSLVVIEPVVNSAHGQRLAAVVTNLAYPVGDLVLLGMVVVVLTLCGWRLNRAWVLLAAGFAAFAVTDSLFLAQTAAGTYTVGTIIDAGWLLAAWLVGIAAWRPDVRARAHQLDGTRTLVVPLLGALVTLGVLAKVALGDANAVTTAPCVLGLLTVVGRMAISVHDNHAMLRRSRHEASTDALTELGNRRRLLADLKDAVVVGGEHATTLVMFDLDGFKTYNDSFGHQAGDALLARIARALEAALPAGARAYRMGGDEFCVIAPLDGSTDADRIAGRLAAAMRQHGEGFDVGASFGVALLDGTSADSELLRIADERMYAAKTSGRRGAGRQSADALLAIVRERNPELSYHGDDVAQLALSVAAHLDLDNTPIEHVRDAALLHDIGKMAIPDAILSKPGPLNDEEWAFMRRHTIIGERIMASAPALEPIARIVRSSHERWDGGGYPDGLAGTDIPLAARIVFVCDAFHAITNVRPYDRARSPLEAIAEVRRCAGTQFAPDVVAALTDVLDRQRERSAVAA